MDASGDPSQGNLRGLPKPSKRATTSRRCSTSLLYRVNAHGGGTLVPAVNPVLAFVATFPPVPPERRHHRARHSGRPHEGPAAAPAAHRHHRRDDDLLLHVRLLPAVRAAHPDRGHRRRSPTSRRRRASATRRCSSTGRTSTTSSTRSSRTGTRRLRGSAGAPRDRRRRMPTISTSSGPSASSSEPLVGLL